jgi:Lipopolysaccharide kinase (Kdo/WaaP) family
VDGSQGIGGVGRSSFRKCEQDKAVCDYHMSRYPVNPPTKLNADGLWCNAQCQSTARGAWASLTRYYSSAFFLPDLTISIPNSEAHHSIALELAAPALPTGWELVASSKFARVAVNTQKTIYYKEFLPRGPLESVKALLRGSRAARTARQSEALRKAGINAPEFLVQGKLLARREYVFFAAAQGHGVTWWLREELPRGKSNYAHMRHELLIELETFIGQLHEAGFIHGDLRTSNVLAEWTGSSFQFSLIDNEHNFSKQPPPGRAILRNLMQLNMLLPSELSRIDRMRFLAAWRYEMSMLNDTEVDLLAREAYQWAMRRLASKGKAPAL